MLFSVLTKPAAVGHHVEMRNSAQAADEGSGALGPERGAATLRGRCPHLPRQFDDGGGSLSDGSALLAPVPLPPTCSSIASSSQVLARGLERCARVCQQRGVAMPRELVLWVLGLIWLRMRCSMGPSFECNIAASVRLTIQPAKIRTGVFLCTCPISSPALASAWPRLCRPAWGTRIIGLALNLLHILYQSLLGCLVELPWPTQWPCC